MVGPNPYRLHSFRELRAIMGRPYVVCRPCRRFVPLGAWLDQRDTRTTTFSCSVCGSDGHVVLEDPAKDGLQHDPRPNPPRHRQAIIRLQAMHRLAADGSRFGSRAPSRESVVPREKPKPPPDPVYRRVTLPIQTFRQALGFGLALNIYCPGCRRARPLDLADEQLDVPFAGGRRFVCRQEKLKVYGEGTEICGGLGRPFFRPQDPPATERAVVDIQCGGDGRHPHWEISSVDLAAAPWAGRLDTSRERFACPGCGGLARHTFHYGSDRPDGGGAFAGHLLAPAGDSRATEEVATISEQLYPVPFF